MIDAGLVAARCATGYRLHADGGVFWVTEGRTFQGEPRWAESAAWADALAHLRGVKPDREIATRLSATAPDLLAALQRIATLDPAEWDLQYIARAALTQGGWGLVGNPARSQNSDDPSHPVQP